jgi:drug/metabolite transporter (DMT)-like permease
MEIKKRANIKPVIQAILAAALFGASAPLAKLLVGEIPPVLLASLLYLGSGFGLSLYRVIQSIYLPSSGREARLSRDDNFWLIGAILSGGVIAPIVLMFSLQNTTGSTASLLLNFEGVTTTIIAYFAFKESVSKRIWLAIILVTFASIIAYSLIEKYTFL